MIHPRQAWAIQIDVTNACPRRCSNCTRMVAHYPEPDGFFWMQPEEFRAAVEVGREFLAESEPDLLGRPKVIGVIGGEPLVHPDFPRFCGMLQELIPDKAQRGLWTGLDWQRHRHAEVVAETFGYFNVNLHSAAQPSCHQPVLVAIQDLVPDPGLMWPIIDRCWLQREWSPAITPKGFFFCEVAAALDMLFEGPGGDPIEPGCWSRDIEFYREQVEQWCPRCGIALPMPPRLDSEGRDDVSPSNLADLHASGSPRIERGDYVLRTAADYRPPEAWQPQRYLRKAEVGKRKAETTTYPPGTRVVRNPETWTPSEFDAWGCGEGVGIVIEDSPGLPLADIGMIDVQWPAGRAAHRIVELMPAPERWESH